MLAVDTNVVVRFLTADDARQFKRAESLIAGDDTWVGVTVTLEIEGVLRSAYDFSPRDISVAFTSLMGLPRMQFERRVAVEQAVSLHAAGMDFADAMHLALGGHCEAFVTFDRDCLRLAARLGLAAREP